MTRDPKNFIRPDGSIDMRAALAAGRASRGDAFANIFFWRTKGQRGR